MGNNGRSDLRGRALGAVLAGLLLAVLAVAGTTPADAGGRRGTVVVANRGDGTLTLIEVERVIILAKRVIR